MNGALTAFLGLVCSRLLDSFMAPAIGPAASWMVPLETKTASCLQEDLWPEIPAVIPGGAWTGRDFKCPFSHYSDSFCLP
jgi:hypothetical protein